MKAKKLFTVLPFFVLPLCSCGIEKVQYKPEDYFLSLESDEDFRILQFTDLDLSLKDNLEQQFSFMDLSIKDPDTRPNLIVVTGDIFTCADKSTAISFFEWLDHYRIPWTITLGNLDEQGYFSIDWLIEYLNQLNEKRLFAGKSYCYFKDIFNDNVTGHSNFVINLVDRAEGKVFRQLFFFDSNRHEYSGYLAYDCIHEDQIKWYKTIVDYSTNEFGGGVSVLPSLAFFHIPFEEFQTAYNDARGGRPDARIVSGENLEAVTSPSRHTDLFQAFYELNSTRGVFVGHDHMNYSVCEYHGIYLSYGIKSTDRNGWTPFALGSRLINFKKSGVLAEEDITTIIHSYKELES